MFATTFPSLKNVVYSPGKLDSGTEQSDPTNFALGAEGVGEGDGVGVGLADGGVVCAGVGVGADVRDVCPGDGVGTAADVDGVLELEPPPPQPEAHAINAVKAPTDR